MQILIMMWWKNVSRWKKDTEKTKRTRLSIIKMLMKSSRQSILRKRKHKETEENAKQIYPICLKFEKRLNYLLNIDKTDTLVFRELSQKLNLPGCHSSMWVWYKQFIKYMMRVHQAEVSSASVIMIYLREAFGFSEFA